MRNPDTLSNEQIRMLIERLGKDKFAGFNRTADIRVSLLKAILAELLSLRESNPAAGG
jgi:hypothetical protein